MTKTPDLATAAAQVLADLEAERPGALAALKAEQPDAAADYIDDYIINR